MRRLLVYGLTLLLSVLITIVFWPLNDSECDSEAFLASKTPKFQIQATKVVIQPWFGEHNVYGIFMVPNEYEQTPFFVLTVKGAGNDCSRPFGHSHYYDGVLAEPGTHLIRDYIRTRTSIRLIFQGLYFHLYDTENWTLTFPKPRSVTQP